MNDNKWLDFFAGGNTIMVRNEQEFNKFRDFIEDLGIRNFLKNIEHLLIGSIFLL